MNFEEEIKCFKWVGKKLLEFDYENEDIENLLNFILKRETELWRARTNIEYKLNQK